MNKGHYSMRWISVFLLAGISTHNGCASGPSPAEIERLQRQRQQAAEAQQAMEEAKRQEQARQAQAQQERMAIEQAEQNAVATERTGNHRGALMAYADALRQVEESSPAFQAVAHGELAAVGQRLQAKILTLAQRLDPPLAPTEEAERYVIRGQMAFKTAKSTEEYSEAAKEFKRATLLAPWWPDPYFNLGLAQAQVGKLDEAVASLKGYVLGAPNAPDVKEVKAKIVELEYTKEQTLRRIQGWQGLYRIPQKLGTAGHEYLFQCGSGQHVPPMRLAMPLEISIESVDLGSRKATARLLRSSMKDAWAGTVDEREVVLHTASSSDNVIEITHAQDRLQLQARVRYSFVEYQKDIPCYSWGKYEGPLEKVSDAKPQ